MNDIITKALHEDLQEKGDITSEAIFEKGHIASALIKSKELGVLSGVYLLKPLFAQIDPSLKLTLHSNDGDNLTKDTPICRLDGSIHAILSGERTALNLLQHLSGVATKTRNLSAAIAHTSAKLLDTRKTTPNMRALEKIAVTHGGGYNHRFGLYDMILIKDTHVKGAGGVGVAIERAKAYRQSNPDIKIEVEIQTINEFKDALQHRPDRIMLDNMSVDDMRLCVETRNREHLPIELEASGNITRSTIVPIAETGVDFISCGSITHSAPALDIHLIITESRGIQ